MGSKSAPPPAPNYQQLAMAQGGANEAAAVASAKLSNPNIYGPLGTQVVTYNKSPTFNETAYNAAMSNYNQQYQDYLNAPLRDRAIAPIMPTKEEFTSSIDTPVITQTLNENAKAALDAQQVVQRRLAELGVTAADTAEKKFGPDSEFKFTGPDITGSLGGYGAVQNAPYLEGYGRAGANVGVQGINYGPSAGQYGQAQAGPSGAAYGTATGGPSADQFAAQGGPDVGQYGMAQGGPSANQYTAGGKLDYSTAGAGPSAGLYGLQQGGVQGPNLQTSLDTSGQIERGPTMGQYGLAQGGPSGPQLQGRLDTSQLAAMPVNAGMTAQQAIMSRLAPQLQAQRAQLETQLANQGLVRDRKSVV